MTDTHTDRLFGIRDGHIIDDPDTSVAAEIATIQYLEACEELVRRAEAYQDLLDALRPLAAFYDVLTESDLEAEQSFGNIAIYAKGNIGGEVALNVADIVAAHTLVEKAEKG